MTLEPDRPLSILFFVTELGRGGAETQLKRVAEHLRGRGHEVGVISLMEPVGYVEELQDAGVEVESLSLRRGRPTVRALLRARRLVVRRRPEIVCCFLFHATLLGVAVSRGAPLIASIRDPSFGGRARLRLCAALARVGLIQTVVANNRTVADQLVANGAFGRSAVRYIPNGLAVNASPVDEGARASMRASLGVGPDEFLWLHVGNFQPPKDHVNLLRAFERVVSGRPATRLRMVGLGVAPPEVASILAGPTLARGRALHVGERNDVQTLMQASDALVLSSSSEGLPNVIMESLSLGTPVVSTDVGGVRELVADGESGLLVEPQDSAALARGMLDLMNRSADVRAEMGRRGRQRILETYDLDRVVDEWESLFFTAARSPARDA